MIVKSIGVCYWRNILHDFNIGPFSESLNVVYAPNGSGKSSLFEALRRGLIDRHNVKGEDIKEIQPWGKDLAPTVTVEFVNKGVSYRITKQFIRGARSVLEKRRGDQYEPFADGSRADELAREILTKDPPSKGLSQPGHWGWAQALWVPQGNMALAPLSDELVSDIRSVLSVQLSSSGSSRVEKQINALYGLYFTGSGRLKKGKDAPQSVLLEQKLAAAREGLKRANEGYKSFLNASADVQESRERTEKAKQELTRLTNLLQATNSEAKRYSEIKADRERTNLEKDKWGTQFETLAKIIRDIDITEKNLVTERKELESLKTNLKNRETGHETAAKNVKQHQEALERLKENQGHLEDMTNMVESARSFSEFSSRLSIIDTKLSAVSDATKHLKELESQRASIVAPDDETLKAITKAITTRDNLKFQIESLLVNLEITAECGLTIDILKGENTGEARIASGETATFRGSPEISVRIPDVALIRASGPSSSVPELREELRKTEEQIAQLTIPFGTTDIDRLNTLHNDVKVMEENVRAAQVKIDTLLGSDKRENIEFQKEELERNRDGILEQYPEWADDQPDWKNLKDEVAHSRKLQDEQNEAATKLWEEAQKISSDLDKEIGIIKTRIDGLGKDIQRDENILLELKKDNRTPEQRKDELNEITMSWNAAKINLAELENQLGKFDEDPEALAIKLKSDKEQAEDFYADQKKQYDMAVGSLNTLSGSGSYSTLAEASEKIADLEKNLAREELEQEAVRLLHDTMESVRKDALSKVSKPVEIAASKTLNRICGLDLGQICLRDTFEPTEIIPEACDRNVGLLNLSGGEREQLYFAVRLALAEVLAKDERQLVVLDDVLTATDSVRLGRVLEVLDEKAKKLQVIVLTCHPERYQPLSSAKFFDFRAA